MNNGSIPILGQNQIVISMTPGAVAGTFDVRIDTSRFAHGIPLAVQCILQAAMSLIPEAYQLISDAGRRRE